MSETHISQILEKLQQQIEAQNRKIDALLEQNDEPLTIEEACKFLKCGRQAFDEHYRHLLTPISPTGYPRYLKSDILKLPSMHRKRAA